MASPMFDVSQLCSEGRMQLAEDLRDNLPDRQIPLSKAQQAD